MKYLGQDQGVGLGQRQTALNFAALVGCQVHEAELWLRRSAWQIDGALDRYFTHQNDIATRSASHGSNVPRSSARSRDFAPSDKVTRIPPGHNRLILRNGSPSPQKRSNAISKERFSPDQWGPKKMMVLPRRCQLNDALDILSSCKGDGKHRTNENESTQKVNPVVIEVADSSDDSEESRTYSHGAVACNPETATSSDDIPSRTSEGGVHLRETRHKRFNTADSAITESRRTGIPSTFHRGHSGDSDGGMGVGAVQSKRRKSVNHELAYYAIKEDGEVICESRDGFCSKYRRNGSVLCALTKGDEDKRRMYCEMRLGTLVTSGTVTSAAITNLNLLDPLSLLLELRIPRVPFVSSAMRRSRKGCTGVRILYIDPVDPLLVHQQRMLLPDFRKIKYTPLHSENHKGTTGLHIGANSLLGEDYVNLLQQFSGQGAIVRLMVGGKEALRLDRAVAKPLALLLMLGVVTVQISWVHHALPPKRLLVGSNVQILLSLHLAEHAFWLCQAKQKGDRLLNQLDFSSLLGQPLGELLDLLALRKSTLPGLRSSCNDSSGDPEYNKRGLNEEQVRDQLRTLSNDGIRRIKAAADASKTSKTSHSQRHTECCVGSESTTSHENVDTGVDSSLITSVIGSEKAASSTAECAPGANVLRDTAAETGDDASIEEEIMNPDDRLSNLVLGAPGNECTHFLDSGEEDTNGLTDLNRTPSNSMYEDQPEVVLQRWHPPSYVFRSKLRPYQEEGVWWMIQRESDRSIEHDSVNSLDPLWDLYFLLSDETGSGGQNILRRENKHTNASQNTDSDEKVTDQPDESSYELQKRPVFFNRSAGLLSLVKPTKMGVVKGGILADSMGLGKTVQLMGVIASDIVARQMSKAAHNNDPECTCDTLETKASYSGAHKAIDPHIVAASLKPDDDGFFKGQTLVVVPLSLLPQWRVEAQKHLAPGSYTVLDYYGPQRPRDPRLIASYTIVLTTYGTLSAEFQLSSRHANSNCPVVKSSVKNFGGSQSTGGKTSSIHSVIDRVRFHRMVLDEGHIIKNENTSQFRACNSVSADIRWILTGTPLQNDLSDAFSLINFLRITPMGTRRWWTKHVTQVAERGQVLCAIATVRNVLRPVMLRRHGRQKGPDGRPLLSLPKLSVHTFTLQLTYEERLFYEAVFEHSKAKFDQLVHSGAVMTHYTHVLLLLLRLRQACSHPLLLSARSDEQECCAVAAIESLTVNQWSDDTDDTVGADDGDPRRRESSFPIISVASDPQTRELIVNAREGRLEACPICLERPLDAVVLTNCWHTLCLTCLLLLQSNTKEAASRCPSCRAKFLPQHVKRLPPPTKYGGESWRQVVLRKHRSLRKLSRAPNDDELGISQLAENELSSNTRDAHLGRATPTTVIGMGSSEPYSETAVNLKPNAYNESNKDISADYENNLDIAESGFFFSTKIRVVLGLLMNDVAEGRSCVVFSQWTSMLDLIENSLAHFQRSIVGCHLNYDAEEKSRSAGDHTTKGMYHGSFSAGESSQEERNSQINGYLHSVRTAYPSPWPSRLWDETVLGLQHKRVDGAMSHSARQAVIEWFMEPNGNSGEKSPAPQHHSESRLTPEEVDPDTDAFLGQFPLGCFANLNADAACVAAYRSMEHCKGQTKKVASMPTPATRNGVGTLNFYTQCGKTDARQLNSSVATTKNLAQRCSERWSGKILLMSLKTGCVGLNLTEATRCYLLDGWWNPQIEEQAMRRIWRFGQDRPVSVFRFVCARTVEERIEELKEWKGWMSRGVLGSEDGDTESYAATGDVNEDKERGKLTLQDLKKLFKGWE